MPRLLGPIIKNLGDPYPLVYNRDIFGGLHTVEDLIERDAIITAVRVEGMKVYVKSTELYYRLEGGIDNSDWAIDAGGAGGVVEDLSTVETNSGKVLTPDGLGGVEWSTPDVEVGTEETDTFIATTGQLNYILGHVPIKIEHVLMNGANIHGNWTNIGSTITLDSGWSILSAGSVIIIKYFY